MICSPPFAHDLVEIALPILAIAILFAVVAWICRPRPRAAGRSSERAKHFVELTSASSASEAEQIAARLRHRGVVALANAVPLPQTRSDTGALSPGGYRPVVAVISTDLDRARAILVAEQRPEGDAPQETIERLLADEDAVDEDWWSDEAKQTGLSRISSIGERIVKWGARVLFLVCLSFVAWLVVAACT